MTLHNSWEKRAIFLEDELSKANARADEWERLALKAASEHPIVQKLQDSLDRCNENNRKFSEQFSALTARADAAEKRLNDFVNKSPDVDEYPPFAAAMGKIERIRRLQRFGIRVGRFDGEAVYSLYEQNAGKCVLWIDVEQALEDKS